MHMLATVAKLTKSEPSSSESEIQSVDVMQQTVSAIKTLSTNIKDYDPVTFLNTVDMNKIVDNMEKSVTDLAEEVRSDKTLNSYTLVSLHINTLTDMSKMRTDCHQGRSDGGIWVFIPPKISPSKLFMG